MNLQGKRVQRTLATLVLATGMGCVSPQRDTVEEMVPATEEHFYQFPFGGKQYKREVMVIEDLEIPQGKEVQGLHGTPVDYAPSGHFIPSGREVQALNGTPTRYQNK